jgi:hypothetical protein
MHAERAYSKIPEPALQPALLTIRESESNRLAIVNSDKKSRICEPDHTLKVRSSITFRLQFSEAE